MTEKVLTKITVQKKDKHRFNLYIDGIYCFSVHEDVLILHQLKKGMTLSEELLEALRDDEEKQRAFLDALNLLSFRPRTAKEITYKLKDKEYSPEIITFVLDKLLDRNLIDDGMFAKQWVEERSSNKGKGAMILRQELIQKGVDKTHIDAALADLSDRTQYETALKLALKRLERYEQEDSVEIYRKIGGLLSRRGFHSGIVSQVLTDVKHMWSKLGQDDSFS